MGTITNALSLLKEIANKPLSVTEAAQFLSVHKSSASRLLSSMQEEGFVKLNKNRKYEIGHAIYLLANTSTEILTIKNIVHPYLEKLNTQTGEAVHLSVLSGTNMTYIDKLDSTKMIRMHSKVGYSYPIYCTAVGKALLAFQKDSDIDKMVNSFKYEKFTDNTITNAEQLKEELKEIRKNRVAYDFGENFENVNCIASPIFGENGEALAGISISSLVFDNDKEKLFGYKDILVNTVQTISKHFGYDREITT